jgi:hypothetical protein
MIKTSFIVLSALCSLTKIFGNPIPMAASYPLPFTRELKLQNPPMKGKTACFRTLICCEIQRLFASSPYEAFFHTFLSICTVMYREPAEPIARTS